MASDPVGVPPITSEIDPPTPIPAPSHPGEAGPRADGDASTPWPAGWTTPDSGFTFASAGGEPSSATAPPRSANPGSEDIPISAELPASGLGSAVRDGLRGGSSSTDAAVLATLLILALVFARWSRRDHERRLSPIYLSLAERPG